MQSHISCSIFVHLGNNSTGFFIGTEVRDLSNGSYFKNSALTLYCLPCFSISRLAFSHECRSLIGYATNYLFCFSINLPTFFYECRSLIGCATNYLFCFSISRLAFFRECRSLMRYAAPYSFCFRMGNLAVKWAPGERLFTKYMAAASLRLKSVCEEVRLRFERPGPGCSKAG